MKIIGITGSMAMGKSTLIHLLRMTAKYPIWDADEEVKNLYRLPLVLEKIQRLQDNLVIGQKINKYAMSDFLLRSSKNLEELEAILYPELAKSRDFFIKKNERLGQRFIFLDIPLLYEKKLESLCDYVIVVTCPGWLQDRRLDQRKKVPQELREYLQKQQLPDWYKRKKADFIIQTGWNRHYVLQQVQVFLTYLREREDGNGA